MRKFLILTIGLAAFLFAAKPQEEIDGIWLTENGQMKVEIYSDGSVQNGKIVWLEEATDGDGKPVTDKNNPDKKLRTRPLVGADILQNLKYDGKTWDGQLYAPKRGITMDVKIQKADKDQLEVMVTYRGFSRQQTWKRADL